MTTEHTNPFVLPGFGQSGDTAQNPVFAGMEMMRKAWQGMAGAGVSGFESAGMPIMSIEDLERRIGELQAVESWLRLNLSMLSNTIQGMEIQRSTMATLRSFATQGMPEAFGGSKAKPAQAAPKASSGSSSSSSSSDKAADTQPYAQAAEDWWNLVQQQFQSLAAATAAGLHTAQEGVAAATAPAAAPRRASSAKSATGSPKAASGTPAKPAAKPAAKSTTRATAKSTRKAAAKRPARRAS